MSSRKLYSRPNYFSLSHNDDDEEETVVEDDGEDDGEEWRGDDAHRMEDSILFLSTDQESRGIPISRKQGAKTAITPGSPGGFLGDADTH